MNKPLITVFGATGQQGGGVARALLATQRWRVRAVTRRPHSAPALALAGLGAQICQADLDIPASLSAAFDGATGAFCVTNFWEHGDSKRETRQAAQLAEAAARSGIDRLIWSTLEDSRKFAPADAAGVLNAADLVPHMDAKAEADAYFVDTGLPVTLLMTSFYWENLINFGMGPRRAADGVLDFALPLGQALLPGIAAADIGACAAALFEQPPATRRIGIAGEHLSGAQMAAALSKALGEPVRWQDVPIADFARLPFPGAADLAAMFALKQRANQAVCAARPVAATRAIHPELLDFGAWLELNAQRLLPTGAAAQAVQIA